MLTTILLAGLSFDLSGNIFAPLLHAFKIIVVGVLVFIVIGILLLFIIGLIVRLINRFKKKV